MQDLGIRILLVVIGLFFVGTSAYDLSASGYAMNVFGILDVVGVLAGIVLILIGIFVKEVRRKK